MAKDPKTLIAVDLGTSSVRVAAARYSTPKDYELFALGQAPSLGIGRGLLENVDQVSYAIRQACEDARLDEATRGAEVVVGINGKHLASQNVSGQTVIGRGDGTVTERDVAKAIQAARELDLPADRYLLHHIPCGFRVDGFRCRRNPVGTRGKVACADTHVVTADAKVITDVKQAILMAGRETHLVAANPIAASQAVLRRDEKERGVIMLDIGGGTMDIVAYNESALYHTSSFPLGGGHVINDISIALNTSQPVAETVLKEHGMAVPDKAAANEEVEIRCFGINGTRRFRKQYLFEVISLRLTEMFGIALEVVKKTGQPAPASTVVLTGGLANLPGIEKLAERTLRMDTRIGIPPPQVYAADTLKNPSYAALIGMLQISSDALFAPAPPPKAQANGGIAAGGLRILQQINQRIDVLRS